MTVVTTVGKEVREISVRRYGDSVRLIIQQPCGSSYSKPYQIDMTIGQWDRLSAALHIDIPPLAPGDVI